MKDKNETPFGFNKQMVLLQVVLVLSPTPSTTTQPAIFEADNIAFDAMHIIMQTTYVFYVHFLNFVSTHTQQKYIGMTVCLFVLARLSQAAVYEE